MDVDVLVGYSLLLLLRRRLFCFCSLLLFAHPVDDELETLTLKTFLTN